jgi:hypothetical protein
MSDHTTPPHDGEENDTGAPIDMLAGLEYRPSTTFLGRIRRTIQRRTAVSQVVSFSWNAPWIVFLEFWTALAGHFSPGSARKDHQR